MNKDEIKTTNIEGLKSSIKEAEKELVSLRVQSEQRKLKNVKNLLGKRKEIARMKTSLREKEIKNEG